MIFTAMGMEGLLVGILKGGLKSARFQFFYYSVAADTQKQMQHKKEGRRSQKRLNEEINSNFGHYFSLEKSSQNKFKYLIIHTTHNSMEVVIFQVESLL